MSDETKRAGANPAEPTPKKATLESVLPAAANRAVALAILQLEDNLNEAARLLAQCSLLTVAPYDQSLAAMRTATRLLRNQSDAAQALARVARGETRHRTIVEYVQGAEPDGKLNSNFLVAPLPLDGGRQQRASTMARKRTADPQINKGGAPRGNSNALKTGSHTREMRAFQAEVRAHIRRSRALIVWARQLCRLREDLRRGRAIPLEAGLRLCGVPTGVSDSPQQPAHAECCVGEAPCYGAPRKNPTGGASLGPDA